MIRFIIQDILRNKIVIAYAILLAALCWSSFALEDNSNKGALSLLNIILFTVPLVSIIFSTIYIYNSSEFVELMVSQPVKRKKIWMSLFYGLSASLSLAFLLAAGVPLMLYLGGSLAIIMILMGVLITFIFTALAFFIAAITRDKAKGIGFSIVLWLFFAILFDGLLLFFVFQFADYPIEKSMIGLSFLNPIDLARVMILMQLDASIMMGYTGAIFKKFLGNSLGFSLAIFGMLLWILLPLLFSLRLFNRKDL